MFINDLLESLERRLVVIYPGRFQPFHQGHAAVFAELQAKFGRDNVFIATTPQVSIDEKNPFNFTEKVTLMHAAGITDNHIIQSTQPYDITADMTALGADARNTVLIFAVGEPDKDRLGVDQVYTTLTPTGRKSKIPPGKQVGDEKPFKTFKNFAECVTVAEGHAYVIIVPEVKKEITINGQKVDVSHGTECRNLWSQVRDDQAARKAFLTQLYGRATPEIAHVFDRIAGPAKEPEERPTSLPKTAKPAGGLEVEPVKEAIVYKDPEQQNLQIRPSGGMGTWDEPSLVSSLSRQLDDLIKQLQYKNYANVEYLLYKAGAVKAKVEALARYEQFLQKQGRRPIAKGRVIDIGEAQ